MKTLSHWQLLRESSRGLTQQMILWGHDVKHPQGNILLRFGMERKESTGLKGTSCYSMEWEGGVVQLHGAVASWHSHDRSNPLGCLYARASKRIKLWNEMYAPIPGLDYGTFDDEEKCWEAFQPLLRWLIAYETWVAETLGKEWRHKTWRAQFSLMKKSPWLAPEEALLWWKENAMLARVELFS
jgi:hypothetical protein